MQNVTEKRRWVATSYFTLRCKAHHWTLYLQDKQESAQIKSGPAQGWGSVYTWRHTGGMANTQRQKCLYFKQWVKSTTMGSSSQGLDTLLGRNFGLCLWRMHFNLFLLLTVATIRLHPQVLDDPIDLSHLHSVVTHDGSRQQHGHLHQHDQVSTSFVGPTFDLNSFRCSTGLGKQN